METRLNNPVFTLFAARFAVANNVLVQDPRQVVIFVSVLDISGFHRNIRILLTKPNSFKRHGRSGITNGS